ncbi:MAG: PilC/PilY family type IV pilus protein, partial [Pseudomonadota bacterium]|nr:PilC/PilY family type IV pilus protein [Pseudomonadota bacterium]
YLTRFDSEYWTGDVMAAPFSEAGVVGPQKWSAADLLDNNKSPHLRQMITYNHPPQEPDILCAAKPSKSVLHPRGGVPFRWDNLSDRQRQDLAGHIDVGSEGSFSFQDNWSMDSGFPSDTFETWSQSRQGSVIWGPGMPFDLATNTDGDVYVVDYNNHRVVKFNSETGKVEASWGNSWVYELQGWDFEIGGEEDEDLIFPSGIAIDMYDNVYVAQHTSHTIKKFDKDGKFLQKFGGYGSEDDDLVYPFDVAVDGSDNIYVVELQNHRIKVLDDKGKHLRTIGSYGVGNSQFKYPNRIAVDGEDNLYVSDYLNHRIQKFDSAGKFVKEWGGFGTANGDFQYPYGIDTDADNNVYVVEYKNRIQQFDSEGEHMATFATKFGTADGELRYPRGIAVADKLLCAGRSVYVADAYNHRVQRFSSTFNFKAKLDVKTGRARLEYLRGDRSNEDDKGYKFRKRESLLGDIVNSEARHVGAPPTGRKNPGKGLRKAKGLVHHPGVKIKSYSKFVNDNKLRREVLYVGSNDGMLHAFDANTGEELLAYLPGNLFSNRSSKGYHYLTDPDYGHRFYVDGSPFVGDVLIKSHFVSEESWRTVLVGTEGAGGRGVFALDVTDPGEFRERNAEDLVLWEFTDQDDLQLGHVLQEPTVALLPNGRWAAIFGNGYENRNSTGWAALFIVFLDADLDGKFTEWDDYVKIQIRGIGDIPNRNGLSTPAVVDTDGDGIHDRVYAGDIHANLWLFDLSDKNPKKWRSHRLYDTGRQQPITVRPEVIRHPGAPTKGNEPNTMVYFGTGQYLVAGDNTTTNRQSFYGVWDRGDTDISPSDLVKQKFLPSGKTNGRVIDPNLWQTKKVNYKGVNKGDRYGWYLDLPESGERVVTDADVRGKEIFFNTLVPNTPIPCSTGGSGWMMSLNIRTGGSPKKPAFDFDGDGKITVADDSATVPGVGKVGYAGSKYQGSGGVPAGSGFIGNLQFTAGTGTDDTSKLSFSGSGSGSGSGSSGSASGDENGVRLLTPVVNDDRIGRLSWQQMTPPRRATSSSVSPSLTPSSPAITPSK